MGKEVGIALDIKILLELELVFAIYIIQLTRMEVALECID